MSEFTIRSESVDVDQIMKQIRARIAEKRGVDYTEDQIRELASVRLEKFLDPKNLRSDLLEQFRKSRPALPPMPEPAVIEPPKIEPPYAFDDQTLFASHRGPMRLVRKLLRPVFKLFFNPNTLNQILHTQAQFNVDMLKRDASRRIELHQQVAAFERSRATFERSRAEWNLLYYEVLHNVVLETTRIGIEVQTLRLRVESLSSRLDFSERRVRALEGVVQYRPEAVRGRDRRDAPAEAAAGAVTEGAIAEGFVPSAGPATSATGALGDATRRRRRRRRGRRTGGPEGQGGPGQMGGPEGGPEGDDSGAEGGDEPSGDDRTAGAEPGADAPDSHDEPRGSSDDNAQ